MWTLKVLLVVCCFVMFANCDDVPVLGGVKQLDGEGLKNAEQELKTSLTKLDSGDGPHFKLGKIYSASHQVVSGSLYKFKVDLIDENKATKKCDVSIWSQPWIKDGIEVTFECEGDNKLVKKHSA